MAPGRVPYRLVLGLLQEIDDTPRFSQKALLVTGEDTEKETAEQALWDVVFVRLSTIQEYGWHAGLKDLVWLTDQLNSGLGEHGLDEAAAGVVGIRAGDGPT